MQRTGKLPIAVTNLQHDVGVTNDTDQELQHFLISRTEVEALEVAVELIENQVWNNREDWLPCVTHLQLGGVWTTAGKARLHRKLPKWTTFHTPSKTWENLEQRHRERT